LLIHWAFISPASAENLNGIHLNGAGEEKLIPELIASAHLNEALQVQRVCVCDLPFPVRLRQAGAAGSAENVSSY